MIEENLNDNYLNLFLINKGSCDALYKDKTVIRNTKKIMRTKSINYQNLKDELKSINNLEISECNNGCFKSFYLSNLKKQNYEDKQSDKNISYKGDSVSNYSDKEIYLYSPKNKKVLKNNDNDFKTNTYNSKYPCENGLCPESTCSLMGTFENNIINSKLKNKETENSYKKDNKNIHNNSINDTEITKENNLKEDIEENNCKNIENGNIFAKKNTENSSLHEYSKKKEVLSHDSFESCKNYILSENILNDLNNFRSLFSQNQNNVKCKYNENSYIDNSNLKTIKSDKKSIKKYIEINKNGKSDILKKKKKIYSNMQNNILNVKDFTYNDTLDINKDECNNIYSSADDNSSRDQNEEIIDKVNLDIHNISNDNSSDDKIMEERNKNKCNIKDIIDKDVLCNFIEFVNNHSINNAGFFKEHHSNEKQSNKKSYQGVNNCKKKMCTKKEEKESNKYLKVKNYFDCEYNFNDRVNKTDLNEHRRDDDIQSSDSMRVHVNDNFILNDNTGISNESNFSNTINKNTINENNMLSVINDFKNIPMETKCHDSDNVNNYEKAKIKMKKIKVNEKNKHLNLVKEKINKNMLFVNKNKKKPISKLDDSVNNNLKNLNNDNNKGMKVREKCKCDLLNNSSQENKKFLLVPSYMKSNANEQENIMNNSKNEIYNLKDIPPTNDISKNLKENYEALKFYLNSLNISNTTMNDQLLNLYCYSYLRNYALNNIKLTNSYNTENIVRNNENNSEINKNNNISKVNGKIEFPHFNKEKKHCTNSYFETTCEENNCDNNTFSNNTKDNKKNHLHDDVYNNTCYFMNNNSFYRSNFIRNFSKSKPCNNTICFNKMKCHNASVNSIINMDANQKNTNSNSSSNNIDSNIDNDEVKELLYKYYNYLKLKNYIIPCNIKYDSYIMPNKNKSCSYYNESRDSLNMYYNFINEHKNANSNIPYDNFCKFHKNELDKMNDMILNESRQGIHYFDARNLYNSYIFNLNYRNLYINKYFYFFKNIIEKLNREELHQLILCQCCYVYKKIEKKITPLDIILDTQILFYDCLNYFNNEGWVDNDVSEKKNNNYYIKDKNINEYNQNNKCKLNNLNFNNLNCFSNSAIFNSHICDNRNTLNKKNSNCSGLYFSNNNQSIPFYNNLENHEISRTSTTASINYKSSGISKSQINNQENQNNKKNVIIENNNINLNQEDENIDKLKKESASSCIEENCINNTFKTTNNKCKDIKNEEKIIYNKNNIFCDMHCRAIKSRKEELLELYRKMMHEKGKKIKIDVDNDNNQIKCENEVKDIKIMEEKELQKKNNNNNESNNSERSETTNTNYQKKEGKKKKHLNSTINKKNKKIKIKNESSDTNSNLLDHAKHDQNKFAKDLYLLTLLYLSKGRFLDNTDISHK